MPECKALTNHMCISLTGSWLPCCRFNGNKRNNLIKDMTFAEFRNNEWYQKIKDDMKDGWAFGCSRCKIDEDRNGASYRSFFNQNYFTDKIEFIEISLSNKCNLTCRMCDPIYSSSWQKVIKANTELEPYFHNAPEIDFDVNKLLDGVDLSCLKRIKYLGGEPFITPEINHLLNYLEEKNILGNLEFECNTNCTFFPKKLLPKLKKFKTLVISLSIDGVGKTNDYIRQGTSWDTIYKNILEWNNFRLENKNVKLDLSPTIQAYNLHDVKNLELLADELGIKTNNILLMFPEHLSINVLPESYLEDIKDDYNIKYYKSIKKNDRFNKFIDYTTKLDRAFNTDIKEYIPSLEKYMENYNEHT